MTEFPTAGDDGLLLVASGPLRPDFLGAPGSRAAAEPLSPLAWCVLASISDRLFELNDRGAPEPNLVASYTVSGNGMIYRFQIHADRKFHHGDEVTADDVIYSLTRAALAYPEGSRLFDLVDVAMERGAVVGSGLRRTSRYKFEVQLRDRCEGFLPYLALPCNSIRARSVPEGALDAFGGPYRVERSGPEAWELRLDRDHPAANQRAYDRILVHCPAPDAAPEGPTGVEPPPMSPLSPSPSVLLFDQPVPLAPRLPAGFKERLARLPGERLAYLRLRSGVVPSDPAVRALRHAIEAPDLQKAYFGLKPPTFLPAVPAVPGERGASSRPPAGEPFTVGVEAGLLRPAFLEALTAECRARGAAVRFVIGAGDVGTQEAAGPSSGADATAGIPECSAWLRAAFVGRSLDEIGFYRRAADEQLPGVRRRPGKGYLQALSQAARATHRGAHVDALRHLARDASGELGLIPLFQATAGLVIDPRIDLESLTATGFTSFGSLRRRSARFDHAELNRAMLTALGAATQMFAHDVRRPFSMVRILLDMIRNAGSLAEVKEMAVRMMPEIERALGAVNGMIQDILEIGSAREPVREVVAPERALEAALREVFETRTGSEVRFSWRFAHTQPFHASAHQVHRVFANILSNAADAMQNRGEIRCETEDVLVAGQPFVRVCLGNSGSPIDPADLPRIFDAFFSKGKRGGTGLGLAITKKIIEAHEGRIWCLSDRERGVEFWFTLPAHEPEAAPGERLAAPAPPAAPRKRPGAPATSERLPAHSREIVEEYQRRTALSLSEDERRSLEREKILAANLVAFRQAHRRPLRIWVLDDEAIYAEGVRGLIQDAYWFEGNVEIVSLPDDAAAWAALDDGGPDACICDIDFGPGAPDGFAVTRELRRRGSRAVIYLHSNRSVPADYREAIEAGADAFLPKPMSRPHLLRLLDETTRESVAAERAGEPESGRGGERTGAGAVGEGRDPATPFPPPAPRQPILVIVDDEVFMRKAWADRVQDARVLAYRGPGEFWSGREASGLGWSDLDCIITDYHFGAGEAEPVEEFVRKLRSAGYAGPILLSSDTAEASSIAGLIDGRIDKRPIPWREIRERLEGGD